MRGNTVMKGYLGNRKATLATLVDDWYVSGDLAVWHADGYIEIKDRSKDIIISGGENISSLEVEEVLHQLPAVLAAARGLPEPTPSGVRRPAPSSSSRQTRRRLPKRMWWNSAANIWLSFKVPKKVVFGELPKTSTGKIQKFVLRERAKQL